MIRSTAAASSPPDAPGADEVVLVNERDESIGSAPKLAAHLNGGRLHRAFSIFIFDSAGRMLLQQRAEGKYHFGGLWSNACCSHPREGRPVVDSAHERLGYEFGFDVPLERLLSFIYRAEDHATGLTEHEFDHVFVGRFDGTPGPNPEEIDAWRWVEPSELIREVAESPERFTPWFKIVIERVMERVGARCVVRQAPLHLPG